MQGGVEEQFGTRVNHRGYRVRSIESAMPVIWHVRQDDVLDLAACIGVHDEENDGYDGVANLGLMACEGGLRVIDRGADVGIYLPLLGEPVLRLGDELLIGNTRLRLVTAREAAAEDPSYQETVVEADTVDATRNYKMRPCLSIQCRSGGPSTVVELGEGETIIGSEEGDIVIVDDADISGEHVRLIASDFGVRVQDLGSVEGTFRRARFGEVIPLGHPMVVGQMLLTSERAEVAAPVVPRRDEAAARSGLPAYARPA